jgi:hypothetical protein
VSLSNPRFEPATFQSLALTRLPSALPGPTLKGGSDGNKEAIKATMDEFILSSTCRFKPESFLIWLRDVLFIRGSVMKNELDYR